MMKLRILFLLIFFVGVIFASNGQSTKDVNASLAPAPHYQTKKTSKSLLKIGKSRKSTKNITGIEETKDFEKRMKKTVRQNYKEEKEARKERYTDHTYFGHKKPPKKRPNGKKKFCKECGLTH